MKDNLLSYAPDDTRATTTQQRLLGCAAVSNCLPITYCNY